MRALALLVATKKGAWIYHGDVSRREWRVGRAMPEEIGDIGFPIVVHPLDPDTAWVFPMDGTDV